MEITIRLGGEELTERLAAKHLHLIADMIKAGVAELDGFSMEFVGAFSMAVDYDSNGGFDLHQHHENYWDGEHNHIHVAEDGTIISRQGPNKEDGTPDVEDMRSKNIKLADWAKEHGGITPFGTSEEDLKE